MPPVRRSATRRTTNTASHLPIKLIHSNRGTLPGLTPAETRLLRKKQDRLRLLRGALAKGASAYGEHVTDALNATFIFAQAEAGTAVCIHRDGWILTCAHCFGEDEQEWLGRRCRWVLGYTGLAVQIECRIWGWRRDLALAKVVSVELGIESEVRNAGDSEGRLNGLIPGADPQDNSSIGTLKHDAWTYWGHSGAPLVCMRTGVLLGLHSSWDESTAMRHGVPLVAIRNARYCRGRQVKLNILVLDDEN
ncbi:hypothetical protein BDW66DRAFT_167696 [Aspergillus desertorum]